MDEVLRMMDKSGELTLSKDGNRTNEGSPGLNSRPVVSENEPQVAKHATSQEFHFRPVDLEPNTKTPAENSSEVPPVPNGKRSSRTLQSYLARFCRFTVLPRSTLLLRNFPAKA